MQCPRTGCSAPVRPPGVCYDGPLLEYGMKSRGYCSSDCLLIDMDGAKVRYDGAKARHDAEHREAEGQA